MTHYVAKIKQHQTYRALWETVRIYTLHLYDSRVTPFCHTVWKQLIEVYEKLHRCDLLGGWIYNQKGQ